MSKFELLRALRESAAFEIAWLGIWGDYVSVDKPAALKAIETHFPPHGVYQVNLGVAIDFITKVTV